MSHWHTLLDRTVKGLQALERDGQPTPNWVLGGGTALMIHAEHRLSKDIDVFIDGPEYLPYLSPRLGGEMIWGCEAYDEATHYLKLRYPEGEIDFIVAGTITDLAIETRTIPADGDIPAYQIQIEHPVEIAVKKLQYRGAAIKVRDAFDICVVDQLHPELLAKNLPRIAAQRNATLATLGKLKRPFFDRYLEELDILPPWKEVASRSYDRIHELIENIALPVPIP